MRTSLTLAVVLLAVLCSPAHALERFDIVTTEELREMLEARDRGELEFLLVNTLDEIIRRVATGGMGAVYEARQENPARRVALKVMRAEAIGQSALHRFRTEIEVLGGLNHPGIAQIHDAGEFVTDDGLQPYFVMEFVPGKPLLEYVSRNALSLAERLELMAKVCDAVHFAHLEGVVHRDLKPENILIVDLPEGRQPKILDFGVAKALRSE